MKKKNGDDKITTILKKKFPFFYSLLPIFNQFEINMIAPFASSGFLFNIYFLKKFHLLVRLINNSFQIQKKKIISFLFLLQNTNNLDSNQMYTVLYLFFFFFSVMIRRRFEFYTYWIKIS